MINSITKKDELKHQSIESQVPCIIEATSGVVALLTKEKHLVYLGGPGTCGYEGTEYRKTWEEDMLNNTDQWHVFNGSVTLSNK